MEQPAPATSLICFATNTALVTHYARLTQAGCNNTEENNVHLMSRTCLHCTQMLGYIHIDHYAYLAQAVMVVNGIRSSSITLHDMVYQGTVWGPTLWNCFYGDACYAIRGCDFEEIIYADDLNCFKCFDRSVSNETIF